MHLNFGVHLVLFARLQAEPKTTENVVGGSIGHRDASLVGCAADVWEQYHTVNAVRLQKRVGRLNVYERSRQYGNETVFEVMTLKDSLGSFSRTSRPAPAIWPEEIALASAVVSTSGPREALMT